MYACAKHDKSGYDGECPSCAAEREHGVISLWIGTSNVAPPIHAGYQVPPGDPCPTCGQAMAVSWRSVFNGREFVEFVPTQHPEWDHTCSWCADPRTKKMRAERDAARDVLRAVEWSFPGEDGEDGEGSCPACRRYQHSMKRDGLPSHAAYCALAKALKVSETEKG